MQNSWLKACLLSLFAGYACVCFAQSPTNKYNNRIPERYWSIDLNAGLIIMPNKTSSALFGTRPTLGFQELFTANYAFNGKWAAYASIGSNYYQNHRPDILSTSYVGLQMEDIIEAIFSPFELIKPTVNAGVMYRIRLNKLEILPKLGLSYTTNDWGRDRMLTIKDNGVHIHYKMSGTVPGMQAGINAHYWVSKKGYLNFGLMAESPLQKPNASATYLRGKEVMTGTRIKSAAYGQNLNVQFGYGFAFARRYR